MHEMGKTCALHTGKGRSDSCSQMSAIAVKLTLACTSCDSIDTQHHTSTAHHPDTTVLTHYMVLCAYREAAAAPVALVS